MYIFMLIFVLPAAAVLSLLLYLPVCLAERRGGKRLPLIRHMVRYAFIGMIIVLLYLTVLWYGKDITFHPDVYFYNLIPFVWVKETYSMGAARMMEQLFLNICMFIPMGFLLPAVFQRLRSCRRTCLCVLCVTVSVETFQFFTGRSADVDDVIMNFLGGLIGYLAFAACRRVFKDKSWWNRALGAKILTVPEQKDNLSGKGEARGTGRTWLLKMAEQPETVRESR